MRALLPLVFFFFNDTATTEIYTLSLHDALPISGDGRRPRGGRSPRADRGGGPLAAAAVQRDPLHQDRKSTRLNSSHLVISYAVFCLKKKKKKSPRLATATSPSALRSQRYYYICI